MPFGTITSTSNTFGSISGDVGANVPGTLSGSVGVPGPQGPPGPGSTWGTILGTLSAQTDLWTELGTKYLASNPAGYQTAGQVSTALAPYITSATATASFYPLTGNPSGFLTASALTPYLTSATAASTYQTLAGMSAYLTTSAAAAGYYPLSGNPSGFLTSASLSGYATESWVTGQGYITSAALTPYLTSATAASTYYPLTNPSGFITSSALSPYLLSSTAASTYQALAGMSSYLTTSAAASTYATIAQGLPTGGTVGQVLTKNSGTNFDASFATLIPGDRYLTSSTTSLTINNANKTLTVGTGLSYTSQQDIVIAHDAANHMHAVVLSYNSGTGVMEVDVRSHTGSGTFSTWTVNVGGTVPLASIVWGDITGTLGNQTDLATALNAKLDSSTAATTYAPIASPTFTGTVTIPSGASIAGFAPLESPALTGNVTITSNSTGAALFIEQAGTGNILTLHDQATDTNFVAIDANGKVNTIPSEATNGAGLNVPHGVAPTTPVNGDIFTTTSGLFMRQNGTTQQYVDFAGTQTINGNKTFSNANVSFGTSTAAGTINVASGATVSGSTKNVNIGTSGVSGSTTLTNIGPVLGASTTTIGATTAASTLNLATGATLTATTKAVNIGTGGVAGSTTNIAIGSTTGTSTTTLQGSTVGTTLAADTNTTGLATTAYVVGQAGSATPLVDGTAAVGTSLRFARQDHVHPTDTSRAALASPTFTGVPAAPTAAVDTNTTQLATTAYVVAQAAAATPLVNGTAAVGTSLRYARADHVHPTDTTRAALASPALTGVPTAPTATAGTNTTQLATTAFVTAAVPAAATHIQSLQFASTTAFTRVIDASSQLIAPSVLRVWPSPSNYNGTATSGAGASAVLYLTGYILTSPSAGVAGNARAFHGNISGDLAGMLWGGTGANIINFSRRVSMAFRFAQFPSSTASVTRVLLGKIHGTAVGDLTSRGIGVKYVPNGANFDFQLQVHDGTTLTSVTSSTQYAGGVADLEVVSDGAGNATLYLNGASVATTTGAPTGQTGNNATVFAEIDSTASTANQPSATIGRLYVNSLNF